PSPGHRSNQVPQAAARAHPSSATHDEAEQQCDTADRGHRLPRIVAHVGVDIACARAYLILECGETRAQILQRRLGTLLRLGAARVRGRAQQCLSVAHQRTQLFGDLSTTTISVGHGRYPFALELDPLYPGL